MWALLPGLTAWDVSQAVQAWVSGTQVNNGFLLRAADEAENGYRTFRSREAVHGQPHTPNVRLVVTWMLPIGPRDPGPRAAGGFGLSCPGYRNPHADSRCRSSFRLARRCLSGLCCAAWTQPITNKPSMNMAPRLSPDLGHCGR